jgi:hypothetical protein
MKKKNMHLKYVKSEKINLPHYRVRKIWEAKKDGYKTGV